MEIFAHRGLCSIYPENTILAFEKALEYDIAGIETDVQLSKDGVPVIIHDEFLDRTTNAKGFVKDRTLAELKELNAGVLFGMDCKIPTLEELFIALKGRDLVINLELKTSIFEYQGIEEKTLELIKKYGREKDVIISSFNHETLVRFKKLNSGIKLGALLESHLIDAEEYVKKNGFDAIHPLFTICTKEKVQKAHDLGLKVNAWTCDWEEYMRIFESTGIDVMMTNCCDKFCKKYEK